MSIFMIILSVVATIVTPIFFYRTVRCMAELAVTEEEPVDSIELVSEPRVIGGILMLAFVSMAHGLILLFPQDIVKQILAAILLVADIAIFGYICYMWHQHHENTDEGRQFVPLLVVIVVVGLLTWCATWRVVDTFSIGQPWSALLYTVLVVMLPIFVIGYCIAQIFYNREHFEEDEEQAEKYHKRGNMSRNLTIIALVLAFLIGFMPALATIIAAASSTTGTKQGIAGTKISGDRKYPHFLNGELQSNNSKKDDYFFGYATDKSKDKDYQLADFYSRFDYDPMYVSAQALVLDTVTGSDIIGQILYQGYEERNNVLRRADAATLVLKNNKEVFDDTSSTLKAFYRDRATKVEWKKVSGIKNQIYADPYTTSKAPSLVLAESEVSEDWVLIFHLEYGKGQKAKVMFRHACGWQWVNAAKELGLEPEPNPVEKSDPDNPDNPSKPSDGKGSPPDPSPKPTEAPKYNKDKTQGIKDPGNVEQGLDKDTNNGENAHYSADDNSNNSDHGTYDDYKSSYNQNAAANSGGNSSGGNGAADTSGGDSGYASQSGMEQTAGGQTIANGSNNPGGKYGGPPD